MMFVAMPRFARVAFPGGAKAAARRMYAVIATAHDKAALQKRRYWLGMELGSGQYWAVATEPAEALSAEAALARRRDAVLEGELPGDVIFADVVAEGEEKPLKKGTAMAVFEPNGTCVVPQIHLEDEQGNVATLMTNALTGRCAVYNSYLRHQAGVQPGAGQGAEGLTGEAPPPGEGSGLGLDEGPAPAQEDEQW